MSLYFNTTPLYKWDHCKCMEYFNTKHGIDLSKANVNGRWLSTAKLRQLRQTFGKPTGEKLFIIVRDRLEREEDIARTPSPSPMLSPMMSPIFSPVSLPHKPQQNKLLMSSLDLNDGIPAKCDFKKSDETSVKYFDKLKQKSDTLYSRYERYQLRSFINKHPPLLWQNEHLRLFLKEFIGIDVDPTNFPDVDDFIFMTANGIDFYFPGKGSIIRKAILSRFINPNIQKITKPVKTVS